MFGKKSATKFERSARRRAARQIEIDKAAHDMGCTPPELAQVVQRQLGITPAQPRATSTMPTVVQQRHQARDVEVQQWLKKLDAIMSPSLNDPKEPLGIRTMNANEAAAFDKCYAEAKAALVLSDRRTM